ncbi:hypothetical protein BDV95DRAFT_169375 [Massariosphaeria phaeospora]|uniref:Uncharacterized protein n=1 Tax=Massariosphaeria phaeospora TaxID=100035 RepID=A0A7C8I0Q0_9PLEO|nr:hypothetical protein BDV95DRAFT_169375 [Massariosphaeria phaeospora]
MLTMLVARASSRGSGYAGMMGARGLNVTRAACVLATKRWGRRVCNGSIHVGPREAELGPHRLDMPPLRACPGAVLSQAAGDTLLALCESRYHTNKQCYCDRPPSASGSKSRLIGVSHHRLAHSAARSASGVREQEGCAFQRQSSGRGRTFRPLVMAEHHHSR